MFKLNNQKLQQTEVWKRWMLYKRIPQHFLHGMFTVWNVIRKIQRSAEIESISGNKERCVCVTELLMDCEVTPDMKVHCAAILEQTRSAWISQQKHTLPLTLSQKSTTKVYKTLRNQVMSGQMNVYGCSCLKYLTHQLCLVKKTRSIKKSMPTVNHSVASLVTLLLDLTVND